MSNVTPCVSSGAASARGAEAALLETRGEAGEARRVVCTTYRRKSGDPEISESSGFLVKLAMTAGQRMLE